MASLFGGRKQTDVALLPPEIANDESPCTTKLYDHTSDAISLDAIERILI